MSRPQRILFENAYYHVMNRGAGRQKIFHEAADYQQFLEIVADAHDRFGIEVHAYCLMNNHYHLLLKTPRANLSRAMRHINGVYTQRYNRAKKTDGALFRGRYKAILVDSDVYLLHLSKYIHLNPYAAKIVDHPEAYPWSSYAGYVGNTTAPRWLVRHEIYEQLTPHHEKEACYRLFMDELSLNEDLIKCYRKGRMATVLGDEAFVRKLKLSAAHQEVAREERAFQKPSLSIITDEVAKAFHQQPEALIRVKKGRGQKNRPRQVAMYLAQKHGDYSLRDIAAFFGLNHYGSVACAIDGVREAIKAEDGLRQEIACIISALSPVGSI